MSDEIKAVEKIVSVPKVVASEEALLAAREQLKEDAKNYREQRTMLQVNNEYAHLCAFMGDWLCKALFENKAIIAKYTEYKLLKREAEELEKAKNE